LTRRLCLGMALWCGPQVLLGFPGSRDVDPAMEVGTSPWETSLDAAPVAFRFQLLGARNHGNTNFRNHASILAEPHSQAEFFKIIEIELELVLPFCPSFIIPVFVSGPLEEDDDLSGHLRLSGAASQEGAAPRWSLWARGRGDLSRGLFYWNHSPGQRLKTLRSLDVNR